MPQDDEAPIRIAPPKGAADECRTHRAMCIMTGAENPQILIPHAAASETHLSSRLRQQLGSIDLCTDRRTPLNPHRAIPISPTSPKVQATARQNRAVLFCAVLKNSKPITARSLSETRPKLFRTKKIKKRLIQPGGAHVVRRLRTITVSFGRSGTVSA